MNRVVSSSGLLALVFIALLGPIDRVVESQAPTGAPVPQPGGPAAQPPPVGGGRRVSPRAALFAQFCASCHGPNLQGGSATSLVDEEWKHGSDDQSLMKVISGGVPGTPMAPFRTILDESQIRQLVFYIREQAVLTKGQPPLKIDPHGQVVKSQRQTVSLEVVAGGLETPWGLAFLPDGRLLVTERSGRLRIVDKGRLLAAVSGLPQVWAVQDGGLLDVEVHPRHARTGWIYLAYSEGGPGRRSMTRIVRGRLRGHVWVDQQDIYKAPPDLFYAGNIHYGTRFIFDRQGHLFYSIGDRGHAADAQDLSKPTGKIHRVNDDGSVPGDNPFVGQTGALGSIWSYGHRHPQGFAFDPLTGKLWASEHGPTGGDELNLIERGRNYGWAVVSYGLEPGISKAHEEGMQPPAAYWNPSIAPAGMAFYSGTKYPGWRNQLFLGALGGQHLRRIEVAADKVIDQEVVFNEFGRVRDVIVGPDGYLYVALNLPGQRMSDPTSGFVVRLIPEN
jgi:glucose/arabinose dehydrogenase